MKRMGYQNQFIVKSAGNYNKIHKSLSNICNNKSSIIPENVQYPAIKTSINNYNQLRNSLTNSIISKVVLKTYSKF